MITIRITDIVSSLKDVLEDKYARCLKQPGYNQGDGYIIFTPAFIVHSYIRRAPENDVIIINDPGRLSTSERHEYAQKLEKLFNSRLETERAPFTVLVKSMYIKHFNYKICLKLDYSVYTGTEDTELLNI